MFRRRSVETQKMDLHHWNIDTGKLEDGEAGQTIIPLVEGTKKNSSNRAHETYKKIVSCARARRVSGLVTRVGCRW